MAQVPRPKARKPLPHPATILLQREWVWARLAVHWRLYRVGYHLHARATWRRAHPERRQQQHIISPCDLHLLLAQRVVRSEVDRMTSDDWAALEHIKEQMQEAAEERRAQAAETGSTSAQAASRAASREQERAREHESRLLATRTQQIGQQAEAALLQLVAGSDAPAQAFQQRQIVALSEELAPPGSSIEERLLAAVIAKARFEALLWRALVDTLLLAPLSPAARPHPRAGSTAKIGAGSSARAGSDRRAQALLAERA